MSDRLEDGSTLKPGDVRVVAVELTDKTTRMPYWWKRFVCVLEAHKHHAAMLTLRMQIDLDKDVREVAFDKDVVTKLEPDDWPQGVIAMRMKWIAKGIIKVVE